MQAERRKGLLLPLVLCVCLLLLGGCGKKTVQETVSQRLHANFASGTVAEQKDSHGGFHGDGFARIVLTFSDDGAGRALEWNEKWMELPMPEALDELIERLPEEYRPGRDVSAGYYFFEDRSAQAYDKSDPSAALARGSVNFTLAVYDSETRTLYYCEADS